MKPHERSSRPDADRVVTVRGLTKAYGGRLVVDHLDLEVAAGEVVGLIGANGAGKTTTVEILQGLRQPDAGEISVLGLDPTRDAERLRPQIGSQLQNSGLPDRIRVDEAIRLFAGPMATDAERLLEQFGLSHRRKYPFAGMSGGERQRLFLVLALLNRPRLVILDELTQGLDPAARRDVWAAVAKLRDAGTTVMLVTHELDEAEVLCERSSRCATAGCSTKAPQPRWWLGTPTRSPLVGSDRAGTGTGGQSSPRSESGANPWRRERSSSVSVSWNIVICCSAGAFTREFSDIHGVSTGGETNVAPASTRRSVTAAELTTSKARRTFASLAPSLVSTSSIALVCAGVASSRVARPASRIATRSSPPVAKAANSAIPRASR